MLRDLLQQLHGNKMDSHNLATLFGPNLLHKAKGGEFEVETMERAEERREVIAVVQDMIENYQRIFEVRLTGSTSRKPGIILMG